MNRRTVLRTIAALFVAKPALGRAFGFAQTPALGAPEVATLGAIADVVLPSTLTDDDKRLAVRGFVAWFTNYRQGADMGHGYGSSTLRGASGPSPIARYPAQFAALDAAAREKAATTFKNLPIPARREVIEAFLNQPQPVNRLPAQPTGANLVADFMGSYFNSQDGWNLCYQAEINRDACRRLDGSEKPPAPLQIRG